MQQIDYETAKEILGDALFSMQGNLEAAKGLVVQLARQLEIATDSTALVIDEAGGVIKVIGTHLPDFVWKVEKMPTWTLDDGGVFH